MSVTITDHVGVFPATAAEANGQFGHHFDLTVQLQNQDSPLLFWLEKADHPYAADMHPNTWCCMNKYHGNDLPTSLFDEWDEEADNSGLCHFMDIPSIKQEAGKNRILDFFIIITDGPMDSPNLNWKVLSAKQTLKFDPPLVQQFTAPVIQAGNHVNDLITYIFTHIQPHQQIPGELAEEFNGLDLSALPQAIQTDLNALLA